jgi:hypothetical protein
MDTPTITLAALAIIPVGLLLWLRVNATLVFLSLCLGNVLVQFVAKDTVDFLTLHASQIPQQASTASNNDIKLVLLLLPVVLTFVFMIRTVRGQLKLILNVLPALGVGLLGALLVVPLLPTGLSHSVISSSLWAKATNVQDLIVGASALICLLVLWMQRPKTGGHEDKHAKHKV